MGMIRNISLLQIFCIIFFLLKKIRINFMVVHSHRHLQNKPAFLLSVSSQYQKSNVKQATWLWSDRGCCHSDLSPSLLRAKEINRIHPTFPKLTHFTYLPTRHRIYKLIYLIQWDEIISLLKNWYGIKQ